MQLANKSHKNTALVLTLLSLLLLTVVMLVSSHAFATDLGVGVETDAIDTVKGTGKKLLYLCEIVVACATWLKSRSGMAFTGVIVLAVGLNFILKLAGI